MTTAIAARPQLAHLTKQMEELKQRGTFFKLRVLEDEQAPVCTYDGRPVINLASNNYLGLCNHPKLREAAIKATERFGVGSGAVRTIAGTMRIHMELEEKIASFKGVEACVVFQSGFAANAGTVSSILSKSSGTRMSRIVKSCCGRLQASQGTSSSSPMASSRWMGT